MALTKILQEGIKDGEIVNADINASAAIATSKISGLATSATTDTTNAANISSGTLPDARYSIELSRDTTPQLGGNLDVNTKNIVFGDSGSSSDDRLQFGASQDLNIFHDGTDSHIRNNEGKLIITQDDSGGDDLHLRAKANEESIICHRDGQVELYYNNVIRLTTDAAGVVVTGNLYQVDNDKLLLGNSSDLEIFHDGSNSYIKDVGTGSLLIRGSTVSIQSTSGEAMIEGVADGAVTIKHDNSKKFETISTGVSVTGKLGIGTTSPSEELTLSGSDPVISIQEASVSSQVDIGTGTTTGYINIQKADGTRNVQISADGVSYLKGGSVGVGLSNPESYDSYANHLVVYGAGHAGMTIRGNYANTGNIYFADGTSGGEKYDGFISYSYPTARLALGTGGTTRAKVTNDGICFGSDTAAANALDDYEEGTYSPTFSTGMSGITYSIQYGNYVKIGKLVRFDFHIQVNGGVSNGAIIAFSLPFNSDAGVNGHRGSGVITYSNINDGNQGTNGFPALYIGTSSAQCYMGASPWTGSSGSAQSNKYFIGGGTYHTP